MADAGTAAAASGGMSILGAAVKSFGAIYGGKAQQNMYNYQAQVNRQVAQALQGRANVEEALGFQRSQQAGYRGAADIARQNVHEAAGNVATTGGSAAAIRQSQLATTQYGERTQIFDAAQAAYGQRFEAQEKLATAGEEEVAGKLARTGAYIDVAGTVAGAGQSVADKWYDYQKTSPTGIG